MISDLNDDAIDLVLKTHHVGHLGCIVDGKPYVVPITYVYDDGYVYGHTNRGQKVEAVRANPDVCLQVDDIQDMKHWRSVIGWGRFEELSGEEAAKGLDILFRHLSDEDIPQQIKLRPTKGVVYRVRLDRKTGRIEHS